MISPQTSVSFRKHPPALAWPSPKDAGDYLLLCLEHLSLFFFFHVVVCGALSLTFFSHSSQCCMAHITLSDTHFLRRHQSGRGAQLSPAVGLLEPAGNGSVWHGATPASCHRGDPAASTATTWEPAPNTDILCSTLKITNKILYIYLIYC